MGLALLVWRDVVYTIKIVSGKSPKVINQESCVTLLGCFSILRFEIVVMNFLEIERNQNGLGASHLAR